MDGARRAAARDRVDGFHARLIGNVCVEIESIGTLPDAMNWMASSTAWKSDRWPAS